MTNPYEFILFYDGHCPICRKEVAWLKFKNKQGKLGFQDINDDGFKPENYGKSFDDLMAEIHGQYPDGRVIKGVEVFYAAYRAVGLGWLIAPVRWPILRPLFDGLYLLFARNRLRLGRLFGGDACRDGLCDSGSGKLK
ncbi:thiol-disulfide oxidoreductase DCC family protein [Methylicorpusculum sp.]|uniref:thiol-disulfide oxidoreductase DCC family protein n=1 Tax=Methylicorpusculum sp. TaxID=2713644 RepID=UPI002730F8DC|nr:DUF393 domain-containing protein [Methylicorpusculum sp.]MDP2179665.1 DUF393 domain-containing protein [Methylicorpusculum sp.]MDP3528941.1 DUF393 domain-containing protein [Methylicorpusculum sp.]MDZ4153369.1 DUF393 domain-containing protein [Methylicorpusculum sp.]